MSSRIIDNPNIHFYQFVYGAGVIFLIIAAAFIMLTFTTFYLKSTFNQYEKMFSRVLYSPLSFFDVTPSGQVMNRFSKDIDEVEVSLHFTVDLTCRLSVQILSSILLKSLAAPYFPISILPVIIIFLAIMKFSSYGLQLTKRIENVTKSPLLSHVATSIQGLSTSRHTRQKKPF
ncbi:ABCC5 [Bugula neritina]|uniref:ABCC5 n=1 Tax=Bugula neritina TaxID=10212 RepID=A0A7J7K637_BUGNE|nr:ABCC5 [Bugula neritina]